MIKGVRHTGVVVKNLEESLHFYRDLLGLKIVKKKVEHGDYIDKALSLRGAKVETVKMMTTDGQMVELLKYISHLAKQKSRQIFEVGISHIAFTVENLDTEYKRLKNSRIKFNSSPQISPDGYAKVTFCKAPEGTLIELVEVL